MPPDRFHDHSTSLGAGARFAGQSVFERRRNIAGCVSRGDGATRKFGSGKVFIADLGAECADFFYKTPVLRGAAMQNLFRITVGDAVAKPAVKSAQTAADQWISEIAESDEGVQEHFTPEEVVEGGPPPGLSNGLPVAEGDDSDLVMQMQTRINDLENQLAMQAPPQQVVDLEAAPPAPTGRAPLFEGRPGMGVDPATMSKLRQMAGPPPKRLGRLEALQEAVPSLAQNGLVEAEAGVAEEDELGQLITSSSDPLHQLLALQMRQTAALVQRLSPVKDPVSAALGNDTGNSSNGVRGCVARDAYLKTMVDVANTGKVIAVNAASDLGIPQDQVTSGLMRSYVEQRMALGDHRMLTYIAQYLAVGWQLSHEQADPFAMGLLARGLIWWNR